MKKSDLGSLRHPLMEESILFNDDEINDYNYDLSNKVAFYHDSNFTCSLTLILTSMEKFKAVNLNLQ